MRQIFDYPISDVPDLTTEQMIEVDRAVKTTLSQCRMYFDTRSGVHDHGNRVSIRRLDICAMVTASLSCASLSVTSEIVLGGSIPSNVRAEWLL